MGTNGNLKILSVGDIHGKDILYKIIKVADEYDKIIFVGDYVDSFNISDNEILYNLNSIINFKKENLNKVELLLGNHDLQYYFANNRKHLCSGFRHEMFPQLHEVFNTNKLLFKASYQYKNYLWTHAGISSNLSILIDRMPHDKSEWSPEINRMFNAYDDSLFLVGYDRGGNYKLGSIFWAHIDETRWSIVKGLHQIVGHTIVENITIETLDDDSSISYVDCLEHGQEEFLVIDTEKNTKNIINI